MLNFSQLDQFPLFPKQPILPLNSPNPHPLISVQNSPAIENGLHLVFDRRNPPLDLFPLVLEEIDLGPDLEILPREILSLPPETPQVLLARAPLCLGIRFLIGIHLNFN